MIAVPAVRAALYARVSSAAQRDAHTIENQLRALPAFAAAQGWTVTETYVDDGRSAKAGQLERREGFARLVRDAEARRFDVLVVADVDRLTRTDSLEERARILGPFQRLGIRIVTPAGGELDLRTLVGELYVTLQAIVAAEENRKRAERVKAGKARAIAEGRKPAGPTPYGLAYARAAGAWSIEPARAAIVREIFARVIAGESCMVIADDLHARGAPPPRGPWTRHKVWQLARSPHAMGRWAADKRRRLVIDVPPIVDEATWHAAQAKLIEHGKRGLRRTRHVYLLEGLAVCGRCGSPIAIRSAALGGSPAAYVCRARKLARRGEARCSAPIVPVADLDGRLWARLAEVLEDPQLADLVQRRSGELAADRRGWHEDVAGYRAELARLGRASAGVLRRLSRELVPEEVGEAELAAIARQRAAVAAQLQAAERAADGPDELERAPTAWLEAIRELAGDGTPTERQRVVRELLQPGAVIDGTDVRLTLRVPVGASRGAGGGSAGAPSLAVAPGCRMHHENGLRIRLVA